MGQLKLFDENQYVSVSAKNLKNEISKRWNGDVNLERLGNRIFHTYLDMEFEGHKIEVWENSDFEIFINDTFIHTVQSAEYGSELKQQQAIRKKIFQYLIKLNTSK